MGPSRKRPTVLYQRNEPLFFHIIPFYMFKNILVTEYLTSFFLLISHRFGHDLLSYVMCTILWLPGALFRENDLIYDPSRNAFINISTIQTYTRVSYGTPPVFRTGTGNFVRNDPKTAQKSTRARPKTPVKTVRLFMINYAFDRTVNTPWQNAQRSPRLFSTRRTWYFSTIILDFSPRDRISLIDFVRANRKPLDIHYEFTMRSTIVYVFVIASIKRTHFLFVKIFRFLVYSIRFTTKIK